MEDYMMNSEVTKEKTVGEKNKENLLMSTIWTLKCITQIYISL